MATSFLSLIHGNEGRYRLHLYFVYDGIFDSNLTCPKTVTTVSVIQLAPYPEIGHYKCAFFTLL